MKSDPPRGAPFFLQRQWQEWVVSWIRLTLYDTAMMVSLLSRHDLGQTLTYSSEPRLALVTELTL